MVMPANVALEARIVELHGRKLDNGVIATRVGRTRAHVARVLRRQLEEV